MNNEIMTEQEARLHLQLYKLNGLILFFSIDGFAPDMDMYTRLVVAKERLRQLILSEANKRLQTSTNNNHEQ